MQSIVRHCFSVTLHNREMCTTQKHAQIQGISSVNTETYHSVSLHLRSRHTDWHTTPNCANLSHITGTTPSTKLDISTRKIPKNIKLADEQFEQPGDIDLLIGADFFNLMLRSDRRNALAITQFYKRQFLVGHSLVAL